MIPPDAEGAIGPHHLMEALNSQVVIQDRSGNVMSAITNWTFWSSLDVTESFDAHVLYDPYAQRWIFSSAAGEKSSNGAVLIGVSQTERSHRRLEHLQNKSWFVSQLGRLSDSRLQQELDRRAGQHLHRCGQQFRQLDDLGFRQGGPLRGRHGQIYGAHTGQWLYPGSSHHDGPQSFDHVPAGAEQLGVRQAADSTP